MLKFRKKLNMAKYANWRGSDLIVQKRNLQIIQIPKSNTECYIYCIKTCTMDQQYIFYLFQALLKKCFNFLLKLLISELFELQRSDYWLQSQVIQVQCLYYRLHSENLFSSNSYMMLHFITGLVTRAVTFLKIRGKHF